MNMCVFMCVCMCLSWMMEHQFIYIDRYMGLFVQQQKRQQQNSNFSYYKFHYLGKKFSSNIYGSQDIFLFTHTILIFWYCTIDMRQSPSQQQTSITVWRLRNIYFHLFPREDLFWCFFFFFHFPQWGLITISTRKIN